MFFFNTMKYIYSAFLHKVEVYDNDYIGLEAEAIKLN